MRRVFFASWTHIGTPYAVWEMHYFKNILTCLIRGGNKLFLSSLLQKRTEKFWFFFLILIFPSHRRSEGAPCEQLTAVRFGGQKQLPGGDSSNVQFRVWVMTKEMFPSPGAKAWRLTVRVNELAQGTHQWQRWQFTGKWPFHFLCLC